MDIGNIKGVYGVMGPIHLFDLVTFNLINQSDQICM